VFILGTGFAKSSRMVGDPGPNVAVHAGGRNADVLYSRREKQESGPEWDVASVRLSDTLPIGPAVPLSIITPDTSSQPGVTIAVGPALPNVAEPAMPLSNSLVTLDGTATTPVRTVALNWYASTSPYIAGYNIYRGTVHGGPYTKLTTSVVTATTYTDTTVKAGTTDFYVITASSTGIPVSNYSNEAVAVIP